MKSLHEIIQNSKKVIFNKNIFYFIYKLLQTMNPEDKENV